jgi:hypothetical protein
MSNKETGQQGGTSKEASNTIKNELEKVLAALLEV